MTTIAPRRILAGMLFGLGWLLTIFLPIFMLLLKAEFHRSLEEMLVFGFIIGSAISSFFLRTLLISSFTLSDRVSQLERELLALQAPRNPPGSPAISS
jgi:hypothetical protein